jgi:hypothetical protein
METAMTSRKPGFPTIWVATIASAVALAFALPAVAQAPGKLDDPSAPLRELARTAQRDDLLALYRLALDNDSQYAAARAQYLATLEREPQARSALLPNLNLLGRANQYSYEISPRDLNNSFNDYGGGLSLTVPVYRPQNWQALEQAKLVVACRAKACSPRRGRTWRCGWPTPTSPCSPRATRSPRSKCSARRRCSSWRRPSESSRSAPRPSSTPTRRRPAMTRSSPPCRWRSAPCWSAATS